MLHLFAGIVCYVIPTNDGYEKNIVLPVTSPWYKGGPCKGANVLEDIVALIDLQEVIDN